MSNGLGILVLAAWVAAAPAALAADISFSPLDGVRMTSPVESLHERRWKHVSRQERDISCGSAALATILKFQYGDAVTETELIKSILKHVAAKEVSRRGGFTLLDLKKVAVDLGYDVKGYKMNVEQLAKLDVPALVPVTIRGYKHFVVYRGMVEDRVIIADPSFGNTLVDGATFQRIWQQIALVVRKPGDQDAPAHLKAVDEDLVIVGEGQINNLNQRAIDVSIGPNEL
jgi:predicted double-glycine peptidase